MNQQTKEQDLKFDIVMIQINDTKLSRMENIREQVPKLRKILKNQQIKDLERMIWLDAYIKFMNCMLNPEKSRCMLT